MPSESKVLRALTAASLGKASGSTLPGANRPALDCVTQHRVLSPLKDGLTLGSSIVGFLVIRAVFAQNP